MSSEAQNMRKIMNKLNESMGTMSSVMGNKYPLELAYGERFNQKVKTLRKELDKSAFYPVRVIDRFSKKWSQKNPDTPVQVRTHFYDSIVVDNGNGTATMGKVIGVTANADSDLKKFLTDFNRHVQSKYPDIQVDMKLGVTSGTGYGDLLLVTVPH